MKIALSGSGGTGKSTLAQSVSEKFNIPLIPEFAREVADEMGIKEIRKMPPERAYEFQVRILERKIAEENKYPTFIADRCMADVLAYYLRWCVRDFGDGENKSYVDKCVHQLKKYDKIIILPWEAIPLEDDGFRSFRKYYQYSILCMVKGILSDIGVPFEIMQEVSLEDRINAIGRYLGKI